METSGRPGRIAVAEHLQSPREFAKESWRERVLQRLVALADARQQIEAIDLIAPMTGLWRKRQSGKTNLLDVVAASGLEMCLSQ